MVPINSSSVQVVCNMLWFYLLLLNECFVFLTHLLIELLQLFNNLTNHCRVDNAVKKEPGEGKWCIDQFGTKGYGNGLTIDLTTEARSNPLALGSDLSKMENAQKPSSFHSFFN